MSKNVRDKVKENLKAMVSGDLTMTLAEETNKLIRSEDFAIFDDDLEGVRLMLAYNEITDVVAKRAYLQCCSCAFYSGMDGSVCGNEASFMYDIPVLPRSTCDKYSIRLLPITFNFDDL